MSDRKYKAIDSPIPFIDLEAQRRVLGNRIETVMARVLERGQFIMGPEVGVLKTDLGKFCGVSEVISCANRTMLSVSF